MLLVVPNRLRKVYAERCMKKKIVPLLEKANSETKCLLLSEKARLLTHTPLRLQLVAKIARRKDSIAGQTADTSGATSDGAELHSRDAAAVTPDTSGVARGSVPP